MKKIAVVGAGLAGSLQAILMAKKGYEVSVFERRPDLRKAKLIAGKSINLALSHRGWKALELAGIADDIREIAIPMYKRCMHALDGTLTYQPYGKEGEAIYSVSRGGLNAKMMDIAEQRGKATIHYNIQCVGADLEAGIVHLKNSLTGEHFDDKADVVFACDGWGTSWVE
jgi:kynurenine 3-monooxygenase